MANGSEMKEVKYGGGRRISCVEDIINIPDVSTAFAVLKAFGIDRKGIKSKTEAIERIAEHWKSIAPASETKTNYDFSEILQAEKEIREILKSKYEDVDSFVSKIPDNHIADLENVLPGVITHLKSQKTKANKPECKILLVGESNAGKSSVINLILGHDILPTGCLATTRNVCEVKPSRGNERFAIFHRKVTRDSRRRAPDILDLSDNDNFLKFQKLISEYDEDTGEPAFEKVEVIWPSPLKELGLVLIDIPGFGENRYASLLLEKYSSLVSGFIYVFNSSSAGGLQKRVRHVLSTINSSCDQDFVKDAAVFVFNKWDTVPDTDKEDIRKANLAHLKTVFQSSQENKSVFISASEALKVVRHGDEPEDLKQVTAGIVKMLPDCFRNDHYLHYQFLSQIVKRVLYSLKLARHMNSQSLVEKQNMQTKLKLGIENLETNSAAALENLRLHLRNETKLLQLRVKGILSSAWLDKEWDQEDCPEPGNWRDVAENAERQIRHTLQNNIDAWERTERISKSIKDKIRNQIEEDFEYMEDRIKELEGGLLGGDIQTVNNFHFSIKRPTKSVKDIFSKSSKPLNLNKPKTLGSIICHGGHFDLNSRSTKTLFKSYKSTNCQQKMRDACKRYIEYILEDGYLEDKVKIYLNTFETSVNKLENKIPEILQNDKNLFNALNTDLSSSRRNLEQTYPTHLVECLRLQGELDLFYVQKIRADQSDFVDITWDRSAIIGSGTFADVCMALMKDKNGHDVNVAVKVYRNPLTEKNVSDILLEDRTLRELHHPNIVKYIGSTVKQNSANARKTLKWALLMEYCETTLTDIVLSPDFVNPGKHNGINSEYKASLGIIATYAIQICEGLGYLHTKSLVHRDLKMENILVGSNDVIKLSDVGLTKAELDITATSVGSPIYMAPEVLRPHSIYDRKADIYSLGIILWEMWYGFHAGEYMSNIFQSNVESSVVDERIRPPLDLNLRPPSELSREIQQCWNEDPESRPETKHIAQLLREMKTN